MGSPLLVQVPTEHTGLLITLCSQWQWYWIIYLIAAWELKRIISVLVIAHPQNIQTAGPATAVGNWLTSFAYLFNAQRVLLKSYEKAKGKAYAIPTRDRYHVCVSSTQQFAEYDRISHRQLSLKAAIWDNTFPSVTIAGLQIQDHDPDGSVSQHVFKYRLRTHLPLLRPRLQEILESIMPTESSGKAVDGGWTRLHGLQMMMGLSNRLNNTIFMGETLASDPTFHNATMRYVRDATIAEEVLHFTPTLLFPIVNTLLMRWSGAQEKMMHYIHTEVQERLAKEPDNETLPMDTLQWLIECSKGRSSLAISRQSLGFIFGSSHLMPLFLTFAFYNLCAYPEYVPLLREEIAKTSKEDIGVQNEDMPLLDSFLKETARIHPLVLLGAPRKVMSPFTFADGTYVPSGNWVCVPQQAIMLDENNYANANVFDGFSPARFYVSMVVKMILIEFLTKYDFKLADDKMPATFNWKLYEVPHPRLSFHIRRRAL